MSNKNKVVSLVLMQLSDENVVSENKIIETIVKVRLIVFQLGEMNFLWPTKISEGQGVDFLTYCVPKTAQIASLQLALEVARKNHDTNINYGQYHLFRLRPSDEEKIFDYIKTHKIEFLKNDKNWLMNELNQISVTTSISQYKGAIHIGIINEI